MKRKIVDTCLKIYGLMIHVATRPYPSTAHRIAAILLMDVALYAAFALVAAIPLSLLGWRRPGIVLSMLAFWLAMDAIACYARKRRTKQ